MKFLVQWITIVFLSVFMPVVQACDDVNTLLGVGLKDLLQIKVTGSGSLTTINRAKLPAASVRLCQKDIQTVGARSLMELLEITVPGLQVIRHHWELPHMGLRGITSDKEDKIMIRVNGRVMNERIARGAITERDFPLMRDIKYIDIIRGAGSSMFGLGAVTMVIDISTYDAETNPGNTMSVRTGTGMEFNAADVNYSQYFKNGLGMYFHAEWADVKGADSDDAPLIFGASTTSINTGEDITRGESFPTVTRDGEGYDGKPFLKTHLGLDHEDVKFWMRYTRGGRNIATIPQLMTLPPVGFEGVEQEYPLKIGYEQFTTTLQKKQKVHDKLNLDLMLSYDKTNVTKVVPNPAKPPDNHHETEIFAKAVAQWDVSKTSDLAFGAEYSAEQFTRGESWDADTWSLLGEWQWQPAKQITTFMGGRIDKNSYSEKLYSPRLSVVYSQNEQNTWKLLMTRSQRMNLGKDNRREFNEKNDGETLNSIEARFERATDNSFLGLSTYYIDLDVLGWDSTLRKNTQVGNQIQWGVEAEMEKRFGKHRFNWSASYNKLLDFDLDTSNTSITATPFGYGNDLADWGKYSTKFQYNYKKDDKTTFNSSLRAFWGYDGSEDFRDKRLDEGSFIVTPGWEKGYGKQVYLNFGMQHKFNKKTTFSANLFNTLGWLDKDLNKRAFRGSLGDYRSEAASVSLGFSVNF